MNPTDARDSAERLAPKDWRGAHELAKSADSPWYRCQALAWVARYAPEEHVEILVEESLRAAAECAEAYRANACIAWPVRALVERGRTDRAASIVMDAAQRAASIPEPASSSEAAFLMLQAIFPAGRKYWLPVFEACWRLSASGVHWRQRRNLRDAVLMVHPHDPDLAKDVLSTILDRRLRERLERDIQKGVSRRPRPFFWAE